MLDLESPAPLRGGRVGEKRLRKRRELDALKDVGSGRRRKNGGATQELLGTSSDCSTGEVRDQEHVGVSVWRGVHGHRVLTAWWWLKWGLGASSIFLLAIITIWLHISTRFELDVVRRHIVRVDDNAKSVPETLELIKSRLKVLESNQTTVSSQLEQINTAVAKLGTRLDVVNTTLAVSGENPDKLRQSIADLRLGVGDLTKQLETVVNKSLGNSQGIDMLNKELNTLKNYFQLNEIDMKNGKVTPPASPNANLTVLDHKLDLLNLSVEIQSQRMDTINTTVLGIERNSTLRIDLEHEDVVALNDDNLNVSSSLASLSVRCSAQLSTLLADLKVLKKKVAVVEETQTRLQSSAEEHTHPIGAPSASPQKLSSPPASLEDQIPAVKVESEMDPNSRQRVPREDSGA